MEHECFNWFEEVTRICLQIDGAVGNYGHAKFFFQIKAPRDRPATPAVGVGEDVRESAVRQYKTRFSRIRNEVKLLRVSPNGSVGVLELARMTENNDRELGENMNSHFKTLSMAVALMLTLLLCLPEMAQGPADLTAAEPAAATSAATDSCNPGCALRGGSPAGPYRHERQLARRDLDLRLVTGSTRNRRSARP